MGQLIARGDQCGDLITVPHGLPDGLGNCPVPYAVPQAFTDKCSGDVFVENVGVVTVGDGMVAHNAVLGCIPHTPVLAQGSGTVNVNGKPVGRLGDYYLEAGSVNEIIVGVMQSSVKAGG
tara:strand:- start:1779 stop:2138 length:360 start_codon:yes stop_codon:yes gene_type:complete